MRLGTSPASTRAAVRKHETKMDGLWLCTRSAKAKIIRLCATLRTRFGLSDASFSQPLALRETVSADARVCMVIAPTGPTARCPDTAEVKTEEFISGKGLVTK